MEKLPGIFSVFDEISSWLVNFRSARLSVGSDWFVKLPPTDLNQLRGGKVSRSARSFSPRVPKTQNRVVLKVLMEKSGRKLVDVVHCPRPVSSPAFRTYPLQSMPEKAQRIFQITYQTLQNHRRRRTATAKGKQPAAAGPAQSSSKGRTCPV
ncbi:hypothetical protein RvY_04016-1 [Ramazzottius varieornatus]|uniref:Uncharacterized protein n=1 Tax=Ramazzottius varieornatus TaxID=947166 RepID=A0A1D1UX41_RAMVA|nr:hypothetical protein RvY_04016-1 [Ramazzottius varieornatus]